MLHEDGSITSVLGKLSSPDSSEDLRPFHDCPFPEYFILSKRKYTPQVDEFLSSLKPCIVKAVITPTFGKPFSIIKEILVLPELSDKDQEIYLRRKIKENLAGSIYSIELYNYRIVPKFDTFKYPVHDYSNKFENINLESDYVIVRFEVIGEVGVVSYALPLPTLKRNTSVPLNFYLRRNIEVLYPGKDIEILEVIQDSGCIADLPVILEKDYLPSK